jgi:hypothetical protein
VPQIAETVPLSNVVRPLLEFGRVDLHNGSASATSEVMMVHIDVTAPIETFASIRHNDVNFATFHKFL